MNIISNILIILLNCIFIMLSERKALHMFQLNSYKTIEHIKWLRKNLMHFIPGFLLLCVTLLTFFCIKHTVVRSIILIIPFVFAIIAVRPTKAKKPLVYTKRIVRLIITISLIVIGCLIYPAIQKNPEHMIKVLSVISFLAPVIPLIANVINHPIESAINRYYISDAKKTLKANKDIIVIGVTGSYGKTSVKFILRTLLQSKYDVLATPESYNTPMGVVKTIRGQLRATHQIFICEMGARHVGDIKEICDIVDPQLGIITSIGPQHLETFKSLDNVKKTKFELADALPADGTVFLNGDDENINAYRSHTDKKAITYGISDNNNYYATDISLSSKGTTFTVHTSKGESETFTTKLVGVHNVINIVGAISICCELGIKLSQLKLPVRKIESVPHRLQLLEAKGVTIIDDAYNSNPSGSKAALDALALFDGFKILVTPGMVELGDRQDELNNEFGKYAASICDYVVLVGKKQTESIYEGLISAGFHKDRIYVADEIQDAIRQAYSVDAETKHKIMLLENDLPDNY